MSSKMIRFAFLLTGLFLLVAASGCAAGQVKASEADQDSTVELASGETLTLTLESNPTTGYSWTVKDIDTAILKQSGEPKYEQAPGSQGRMGAGGVETFQFEAVASGTTTLTLIYARSWETNIPPVRTYTLKVVVK